MKFGDWFKGYRELHDLGVKGAALALEKQTADLAAAHPREMTRVSKQTIENCARGQLLASYPKARTLAFLTGEEVTIKDLCEAVQ